MKNAVKRDLQPHRRVKYQGPPVFATAEMWWLRYGILAVEFTYKGLRNIHAVSSIDNWNARHQ
jgi:hypothetical protein